MLYRDTTARFDRSGFWIFAQYRFTRGSVRSNRGFSVARGQSMIARAGETPVALHFDDSRRRRWWLFKGEVYWEDNGYDEQEMKALLLQRLRQKERRLARALDLMEGREIPGRSRRGFIAEELKRQVWNRDRGRCVECGSHEDLQYDHIIAVASGGATSLENLQLLCRSCNVAKGASIA